MRPFELLSAVLWSYFILAILAKVVYPSELPPPAALPALYAALFLVILIASFKAPLVERASPKVRSSVYLALSVILLLPLGWTYLLGGTLAMLLTLIMLSKMENKKVAVMGVALALGSAAFGADRFGVPLLEHGLRYTAGAVPYLVAGDVLMITLAVYPSPAVLLLAAVIAVLGTSRTIAVGAFLAYLMRLSYDGRLSREGIVREKWKWLAIAGTIALVFAVRYLVTVSTYSEWRLDFFGTLLYRAGLTYTVYERLFEAGMPWGVRTLLFRPNPTHYVGGLFGKTVGYTYSLFGQPAYDFGVFGLIEATVIGTLLREASKEEKLGSFAMALTALMAEIGVEGIFLAALSYSAYLSLKLGGER